VFFSLYVSLQVYLSISHPLSLPLPPSLSPSLFFTDQLRLLNGQLAACKATQSELASLVEKTRQPISGKKTRLAQKLDANYFARNLRSQQRCYVGSASFDRKPFGRLTFGRLTFGQLTFGRLTFGRLTFGQLTFGQLTFGRLTFG
jgi:hypothetical protein